eukprot:TRINITY_DN13826_c1_g1_i1.p1 TRINITY_DN13826_c1_g1~~TRINITY_DN13826_c1_g1_i1.p1  ORF type:complete len:1287 (+),score=199.44 TRINITY_DN13826_c1_g1_i1:181-4041(+)
MNNARRDEDEESDGSPKDPPARSPSKHSFAESSGGGKSAGHTVCVNDRAGNAQYGYPQNFLKTSHYTFINFIPLNLLLQFQQFSNVYFLLVMVISLVPNVSPITPLSAVVPLVLILGVAMIKDGYEDFKRHIADRKDNSGLVTTLVDGAWKDIPSSDLEVGDIIKLERGAGEACPVKADIVILSSSEKDGVVFIETSQLDGETSVKPRKAREQTQDIQTPSQWMEHTRNGKSVTLHVDEPNPKIYVWQGVMDLPETVEKRYPIFIKNVIWRGSSMRKTAWVIGAVLYTGMDTKQGRNLKQAKRSISSFYVRMNALVAQIFVFKHIVLFPLAILNVVWNDDNRDKTWYLMGLLDYNSTEQFFLNYMTYFVLLSFMIPISLFVTVEFCKIAQYLLMVWDSEMLYFMKGVGWVNCRPKTSDLNSELGLVKYVFSDKTGTLTENIMRYMEGAVLVNGVWETHSEGDHPGTLHQQTSPTFHGLSTSVVPANRNEAIGRYLATIGMCHSVIPFVKEDGKTVIFEGSSPDEVALVQAACNNKFTLTHRESKLITITVNSVDYQYTILKELEFSPTRKMMSLILEDSSKNIFLLCKGADSSILNNLSPDCLGVDQLKAINDILVGYASNQYRTLVSAYRPLDRNTYNDWESKYTTVMGRLDRTDEDIDRICMSIETNLTVVGVSAYEDKLQDGVPDTIRFLTDAGVVVWILTGDKLETGVEIGKTCGLCDQAEIIHTHINKELTQQQDLADDKDLQEDEREERRKRREQLVLGKLKSATERAINLKSSSTAGNHRVTIAIDGTTIDVMQLQREDREIERAFVALAAVIHSAICCRLTPGQKGYIVSLFQKESGRTALAIGDGANDATMISAAKVGIGIIGLEGSQAELASDYAIARFRFLQRLLCVHGRYALYRSSKCATFSFYKNIVLSLCQVYFALYSAYTGNTIFDSWLLSVFNTFFSFFPPFMVGAFGKDIPEEVLMDRTVGPKLYADRRDKGGLDSVEVLGGAVSSFIHGSLVFWLSFPVGELDDIDTSNGRGGGLIHHGTVVMTLVVVAILMKAILILHQITATQLSGIAFSFVLYFAVVGIYSLIPSLFGERNVFYGTADTLFVDVKLYFLIILIVIGVVVFLDFTVMYIQRHWFPTLRDIAADNYEYKDPPWSLKFPFFGCSPTDESSRIVPEITEANQPAPNILLPQTTARDPDVPHRGSVRGAFEFAPAGRQHRPPPLPVASQLDFWGQPSPGSSPRPLLGGHPCDPGNGAANGTLPQHQQKLARLPLAGAQSSSTLPLAVSIV